MSIREEVTYRATPQQVLDCFSDPDFLIARYNHVGAKNIIIEEISRSGNQTEFTIKRDVPLNVPKFARKLIHPMTSIVHTEKIMLEEAGKLSGTTEFAVHGTPIRLEGSYQVIAGRDGRGSVHRVEARVIANIPLVGSKLATFLEKDITPTLREELLFNQAALVDLAD